VTADLNVPILSSPGSVLSPNRVRLALAALMLGGFAIGCTEFVAMGLLPNIAADLLPGLYAHSPAAANASTGWMITAYAAGVVVGAPTIAALAASWPRKRLLLTLLCAFVVGTLASAALPSVGWVICARFAAGLPHGAYFGIATLVAGSLLGPSKRGRGIAIVISGLSVANIVGVPVITWLGQIAGWRVAYLVVAALFAATFVAVWWAVPWQPGDAGATARRELAAFGRGQVWFTIATVTFGFGGFFAVYSYVAPMATDVSGLPAGAVPFVLMTFGIGMTLGNIIGGRLVDWSVRRTLYIFFPALIVSFVLFALTARYPVGLFGGFFLIAMTASVLSPVMQARLMDTAHESKAIAASLNHSAFNISNSLGAMAGGYVIATGQGYIAPIWVGAGLTVIGLILAVLSFGLDRRWIRRGIHVPYATGAISTVDV